MVENAGLSKFVFNLYTLISHTVRVTDKVQFSIQPRN